MNFVRWIMFRVSELPDWALLPLRPLVWHPERIVIIAAAFVAGYFLLRSRCPGAVRWPLLVPALVWAGFAVWETQCLRDRADIRVDLLLIYPLLVLTTFVGLLPSLLSVAWGIRKAEGPSP